ncbi:MAG: hypothetical protein JWP69_1065 [Flaviaesturariibacter sp.]|nr:hypothetical protein [Flaviaesturariibacter sp.]
MGPLGLNEVIVIFILLLFIILPIVLVIYIVRNGKNKRRIEELERQLREARSGSGHS